MAVKPEFAHVRAWCEEKLELTLGWNDILTSTQIVRLPRLRKHFWDMPEIASAAYYYEDKPRVNKSRLSWVIIYDAAFVRNDNDTMRQHLEQLCESTIQDVLFGLTGIDEHGTLQASAAAARSAHVHMA